MFRLKLLEDIFRRVIAAVSRDEIPPGSDDQTTYRITIVDDFVIGALGRAPIALGGPEIAPGVHWSKTLDLLQEGLSERLRPPMEKLLGRGEGFSLFSTARDGLGYRISGSTSGLQALLEFSPLSRNEMRLLGDLEETDAARRRAERLVDAFAAAPVAAMQVDASSHVLWSTASARSLADRLEAPEILIRQTDEPVRAVLKDGSGERHIGVTGVPSGDAAERLMLIEDHSITVAARASLANFMSTMTETFAHLGTALAVFDNRQSLSLFNPSFTELFDLDAAALAGRPTLRDVLEALRHARKLPEQDHFTTWRDGFISDVTTTREAPLVQDWYLPGGEILRMTARPHGSGSVVLLFEDISDHISLERRYRVEIETGQSILDRLTEGVAVFSSSGQVVYCNPAFAEGLGFDPFRGLLSGGIQAFVDHASSVFGQRDNWQSFREYALGSDRRQDWIRSVEKPVGGTLWLRANPLPDGSTMLAVASGGGPGKIAGEASVAMTPAERPVRDVGT